MKNEYKNCLRLIRNGKKIGNSHRFSQYTQLIVIMSGADEAGSGLSHKNVLDLDDAIQYSAARSLKTEAIVSFDKHFNGP